MRLLTVIALLIASSSAIKLYVHEDPAAVDSGVEGKAMEAPKKEEGEKEDPPPPTSEA